MDGMDVKPILESAGQFARTNFWYNISPSGELPSCRVGHACVVANNGDEEHVYIIGGATPDGPLDDVHVLSLGQDSFHCSEVKCSGFEARYEHTAAVARDDEVSEIFVFGGARQDGNINSTQVLNIGNDTKYSDTKYWKTVSVTGDSPSARTCHFSAVIGRKLFVFGGGLAGMMAIDDQKMHVFDMDTSTWEQPQVSGAVPSARHGHVMVAVETSLFMFGGMSASGGQPQMHDDLYRFTTDTLTWSCVKTTGDLPSARAASAATSVRDSFYMFGGMSQAGALDDLYQFHTGTLEWTKIEASFEPAARLDHTLVSVQIMQKPETAPVTSDPANEHEENQMLEGALAAVAVADTSTNDEVPSRDASTDDEVPASRDASTDDDDPSRDARFETFLLLFGGMDTDGMIFDDCFVLKVG